MSKMKKANVAGDRFTVIIIFEYLRKRRITNFEQYGENCTIRRAENNHPDDFQGGAGCHDCGGSGRSGRFRH